MITPAMKGILIWTLGENMVNYTKLILNILFFGVLINELYIYDDNQTS